MGTQESEIILEGDCAELIEAIQAGGDARFQVFGALLKDILLHSRSFHVFSCFFVKRTGNRLAHALAHFPLLGLNVLDDSILPAELASII